MVYLNGHQHTTISRGNEVTIYGLLPYTSYTVEIQTEDGFSQKSDKVNKTFKTNEAGKCRLHLCFVNLCKTSIYTVNPQ